MDSSVSDLYRPFRPRMTRTFARVTIALLVVGTLLLLVLAPGTSGFYDPLDMLGIMTVAGGCVLLTWRHGTVVAFVTPIGLRVRNLVHTTVLTWPEIEAVRFGNGLPWVSLDLTNGQTLAVMAIQSADGAFATQEARRLATLVQAHGAGTPNAGGPEQDTHPTEGN